MTVMGPVPSRVEFRPLAGKTILVEGHDSTEASKVTASGRATLSTTLQGRYRARYEYIYIYIHTYVHVYYACRVERERERERERGGIQLSLDLDS